MELLRRVGVDEQCAQWASAHSIPSTVIFAAHLNGPEITRWRRPSVAEQRAWLNDTVRTHPAQPWQRVSQALFETGHDGNAATTTRCRCAPGMAPAECADIDGGGVRATLANGDGEELLCGPTTSSV